MSPEASRKKKLLSFALKMVTVTCFEILGNLYCSMCHNPESLSDTLKVNITYSVLKNIYCDYRDILLFDNLHDYFTQTISHDG
jgi:hypothetical protein